MGKDELRAYYRHLDNIVILRDNIFTEREEGIAEGMEKGMAKGREEGIAEVARKMKRKGIPDDMIAEVTGLSADEINALD